ncbi:MAG: GlxA family transcriptional regulator [Steroidobacter sp.]
MLFAILPEVVLLDVAGAAEPFRMANQQAAGSYSLRFVGPVASTRAGVGLQLHKLEPLPARVPDHALVVITGVTSESFDIDSAPVRKLARWLIQTMRNETVTLMCVCAGSLIAARAGLLAGRECTTHHEHLDTLSQLEPSAVVHANRIFVEDGRVLTSAGVTAGTDLTLYLIGQQLGHQIAAAVARDLVVYMRRSGADPQLSPWVMHRNHLHPAVHRVQDAIVRNPSIEWTSARLADVACMSSRNLARLFAEHAGCSPLDYVQRLRVAMARELVSNSNLDLERVAEKTGFSSAHQMRRVWRRWETASPAAHRVRNRMRPASRPH